MSDDEDGYGDSNFESDEGERSEGEEQDEPRAEKGDEKSPNVSTPSDDNEAEPEPETHEESGETAEGEGKDETNDKDHSSSANGNEDVPEKTNQSHSSSSSHSHRSSSTSSKSSKSSKSKSKSPSDRAKTPSPPDAHVEVEVPRPPAVPPMRPAGRVKAVDASPRRKKRPKPKLNDGQIQLLVSRLLTPRPPQPQQKDVTTMRSTVYLGSVIERQLPQYNALRDEHLRYYWLRQEALLAAYERERLERRLAIRAQSARRVQSGGYRPSPPLASRRAGKVNTLRSLVKGPQADKVVGRNPPRRPPPSKGTPTPRTDEVAAPSNKYIIGETATREEPMHIFSSASTTPQSRTPEVVVPQSRTTAEATSNEKENDSISPKSSRSSSRSSSSSTSSSSSSSSAKTPEEGEATLQASTKSDASSKSDSQSTPAPPDPERRESVASGEL